VSYSMSTKFGVGDWVFVAPIDTPGRVIGVIVDRYGTQYLVRYWEGGAPVTETIFEDELTADKNKKGKIGVHK
jgi:hypothetical protein